MRAGAPDDDSGDGDGDPASWSAQVGTLDAAPWNASNTAGFVEFRFRAGFFEPEFALSSVPSIPVGFVPNILPMPE
jgi:hypothetical protein